MQLSDGAIVDILNGGNPEKPVLQVLNVKKITAPNASDRYRLLLSDGDHTYSHAMLAAQMNKLLENDEMKNMAVIEVTKYMCNTLGEKRVLILLDLNVLTNDVGEKIGDPVQLSPTNIPTRAEVSKANSNGGSMAQQKPAQALKPNQNNNNTFNKSGTPGTPSKAVHSIVSLTPYQNRWRIRARVTQKGGIRTWSNSRGEGKLFSVNLLDDSGEIRMTGFNDQVDKYHDMLEINKVFYVSKCTLKTANKQYSNLKNDYEMTMTPETLIEACNDDVSTPELKFEFVKINELEKVTPNTAVDVIGIVKTVNEISTVIGKASQKEISKRDLEIVDQSGVQINMTLWGNEAINFDGQGCPVMAARGCKVSDYGGRSLSASGNTTMIINPDLKEAHILRGWWDSEGREMSYSSFQGERGSQGGSNSNWKMFSQCSGGSGEILQLRVRRVDNDPLVDPPAVSAPPSVDEQTDASQYSNSDPSREGLPYNYTDLGVNGREVDNPFMMYIPTTESTSHGTGHLQYPHTNEVQPQTPAQAHTQPQPLVYPYPGVIAAPSLPKAPKIPTVLYSEETKRPVHWMPFGDFNQLDTKVIWDEAARYGMEEKIAFLKQLAEKEAGRRSQTSKQDPFETDEESVHNASQPQSSDILIPTQVSTQTGSGNLQRSSSCEPSGLDVTMQNQDLAATAQPSPRRSLSREKSVFSQGATNALYSSAVVPQTKLAKKVDNSSTTPVPMPRSLLMMEGAQSGANAVAIEMPESEAYHGASFNKEEEIAASGGASSTSASEETGEIMSRGGGSAGMTPEVKTASMQADCGVAVSSPSVAGHENIEPVTQVSKSQHKMQQKKLLTAARDKKKLDATSSNIEAMKPETYGVGARPKVVEKKIKKKSDSSAPRLKTPEKSDKKKGKDGEKEAMKDEESGETAVAQGQPKKDKSTLHLEDFLKHMKKVKKDLRENIVNDVTKTTARLLKKNLSRSVSLNEKTHADTLTVHKGITCDYCDQEIVGVRYKCGNCSDFDLCQKCEASEHGHEATHVFLKMLRPSRKAGCVGKSRFPLLKENIYLAEKARQEKMMKKIEQQKAADLEKWLNEDLTTKGQLEKVSEILERSVTQTVVTVVADTEVKATEAQQEPQQKLSRRGSDTSGSSIVRLSPPLPVIIRQPDEAKVSREWTQDAAVNESLAEPLVAEETVNNITNLEASMENSNALDDACSLASGSSYEYFPSDDSEEFCILTPPAREEYERIGTEENEEKVEVACEPPSYQEVEQQQMTESLQSIQQELPTKEGSHALQVDPVLTESPEVNPEYPAEVENHGLGELVHTLTDQEKRIYEVMLNAELSKAIQEEKRVKEAKKESEKKGKKELLRRHLEEERELTKESSPKPTKKEEDYAEILTIKAMQASLVNRQLEHTDDVKVTEGEVKGQELRSLEAISVEQEPTVQVRDNTAIYKTMRDDHMAQMLELEVEKFSALDAGDLEAVDRIEHSLKQLDMAAPMMQDAAKNVACQEATTPLLARQASSVSTSTSASESVDAQVTTSDPSVKDADCQTTPESVGQASHLIHNVAQGVHKAASSAYMTAKDVFFSLQAKQNEKKNAAAVDAAGQVLWTPPSSTWMPKESTWVPLKNDWAPPKSAWTQPTNDFKPPSSSYSPQYDDYTPPQSQWLPPQDVWLPPVEVISEATLQAICKLDAAREQSTKTDKTVTSANKKSDEETVPKRLSMSSVSSVSSTASQGPAPIASLNIADSALRKEIQGMQHLIEMGFANREKNRALLAKHDGDLELVVGSLLQEEGEGHWALDRH